MGDRAAWAADTAAKIENKMRANAARNMGRVPYTSKNHIYDDKSSPNDICWWTNGFYAGLLWQLYNYTGEELFMDAARASGSKLRSCLLDYAGMDHDSGFRFLPTFYADYLFSGNEECRNVFLLGASNLAGRFNPAGNFIRAWNDWKDINGAGWTIIDSMMNIPLLYISSEVLGDDRFRNIAVRHADTVMKNFIREDASVRHIVEFDHKNGQMLLEYGGQGLGIGSSWSRGQSWAMYGFLLSYIHTGDEKYLETSKRVSDRFIERLPEGGIVPVDFDQPAGDIRRDECAAAIAACALIRLEKFVPGKGYGDAALKLLERMDADCDYDPAHDEMLSHCTAAYHDEEYEFSMIYGDYFFTEAILALLDKDLMIW